MDIIIGREKATTPGQVAGRLELTVNGKKTYYGAYQSVDQHVSGQHCTLTVNPDGTMSIKNMKMQNYTYVNGQEVHSKVVTMNDTVILGGGGYVLPWAAITPLLPKQADVRHLKRVFDDYEQGVADIQKQQQRQVAYRSVIGVFSTLAIALGIVLGTTGGFSGSKMAVTLPLYGIVIIANIYFAVKAFKDNKTEKMNELKKRFQRDCVCPGVNGQPCGQYFGGFGFYANLPQQCPKCKAMLIK